MENPKSIKRFRGRLIQQRELEFGQKSGFVLRRKLKKQGVRRSSNGGVGTASRRREPALIGLVMQADSSKVFIERGKGRERKAK